MAILDYEQSPTADVGLRYDTLRLALWSIATTLSGFETDSYRKWAAEEAFTISNVGSDRPDDLPWLTLIVAHCDDRNALSDTLKSVSTQIGSGVEIIVACSSLSIADLVPFVESLECPSVSRIVQCDGGLAKAEADAVNLARGQFIAFLSEGDLLARGALACIVGQLRSQPKLDMIYSDEDWIDGEGQRLLPRFKTGWDPYAQLGFDLPGRLCVMRLNRVKEVGGMRAEHAPAHHYDLHSRLGRHLRSYRISHLPHILCHRRAPGDDIPKHVLDKALAKYERAARHVAGLVAGARVEPSSLAPFINKIVFPVPDPAPLVSVMIPTRDRADLLRSCVRGVLTNTSYPNIELLILDNDSCEPETTELFVSLLTDPRVRVLRVSGPFNYSRINNVGASRARGTILLLLNNDIEVIGPEWLAEMVRLVVREDVGCVGSKLLYADRCIQHAGVVLDSSPLAMHAFRRLPADAMGYDAQLAGLRSYSAVTGACLAIRRDLFMKVGGFDDEGLKIAYNDLDLCLKSEELGYINLCTPFEPLFHLEGASRSKSVSPEKEEQDRRELRHLLGRWPDRFRNDIADHPNLKWDWNEAIRLVRLSETYAGAMSRSLNFQGLLSC
ncbi:glycosyltransferase family 2 protein [Bradyrhizobium sp. USDA 4502]